MTLTPKMWVKGRRRRTEATPRTASSPSAVLVVRGPKLVRGVLGQCAAANCSLSVEPTSAVVDEFGLMAEVT